MAKRPRRRNGFGADDRGREGCSPRREGWLPSSGEPGVGVRQSSLRHYTESYPAFPDDGRYAPGSRARKELGEVSCAFDSQVDRAFLVEVLLIPTTQQFSRSGAS